MWDQGWWFFSFSTWKVWSSLQAPGHRLPPPDLFFAFSFLKFDCDVSWRWFLQVAYFWSLLSFFAGLCFVRLEKTLPFLQTPFRHHCPSLFLLGLWRSDRTLGLLISLNDSLPKFHQLCPVLSVQTHRSRGFSSSSPLILSFVPLLCG